DSGAGAGIQADLKTFASFGVYGLTVITAVTAQNTIGVRAVEEIEPTIVAAQLDAVAEDFSIAALKTGMLSSAAIIEVVAQGIRQHGLGQLVIDLLIDRDGISEFAAPRVSTTQTHGTGCTFSAAITAGLARGLSVPAAVGEARRYVSTALNNAPGLGHGHGPLQHFPVSEGVHVLH